MSSFIILHCEVEPSWELYPFWIRLKVFFGLRLSEKELKEHGLIRKTIR